MLDGSERFGDGGLAYGRESVSETFYTAHIGGLYLAAQISFVNNPGLTAIADRSSFLVCELT